MERRCIAQQLRNLRLYWKMFIKVVYLRLSQEKNYMEKAHFVNLWFLLCLFDNNLSLAGYNIVKLDTFSFLVQFLKDFVYFCLLNFHLVIHKI